MGEDIERTMREFDADSVALSALRKSKKLLADYAEQRGLDVNRFLLSVFGPSQFSVIPTRLLKRTDISQNAKLLYCELLALSKMNGYCFATNKYLAAGIGIASRTVPSLLNELASAGLTDTYIKRNKKGTWREVWVTLMGEPPDKKVGEGDTAGLYGGGTVERGDKRDKEQKDKEQKIRDSANTPFPPFSLKEEIGKLKKSPQRHIQLIGEYLEESGFESETKKAFDVGWRRHLKDAVSLSAFEDSQIGRATDYANREYKNIGWNLGTLVKIITSNLYAKK